jgi:outer membrane protein OmpA-like peptidoglycan-associated protein
MKNCYLSLFFILLSHWLTAQNFIGLQNSHYAGVYGIDLQPASMVDSRIKWDFNLVGVSSTFFNDYVDIRSPLLLGASTQWDSLLNGDDATRFFPENLNEQNKYAYFNTDVHLPSLMLSLGEKHSIALTSRVRTFFNLDNVSEILAMQLYREINAPEFWGNRYNNDGLQFGLLNYLEVGLGYGRVLYDRGDHFLKGSARLKRLFGGGAAYFRANSLDFQFDQDTLLSTYDVDADYGHSPGIAGELETLPEILSVNDLLNEVNRGWGLDLGFVYEYRPRKERYNYGVGRYRAPRRDREKYLFRLGFSVLDIGGINFLRDSLSSGFSGSMIDYSVNRNIPGGARDLDAILAQQFDLRPPASQTFRMALPTSVSMQVDLRLSQKIALNYTPFWGVRRDDIAQRVRILTRHSASIRYDSKWLGITLPVSFGPELEPALGAMLRLGPVVVGSDNIFNLYTRDFVKGANVYAALRMPIPHAKPKDRDNDGIRDYEDRCPEIAGIESLKGCRSLPEPDTLLPRVPVALETGALPPLATGEPPLPEPLDLVSLRQRIAQLKPPAPPQVQVDTPAVAVVPQPEAPEKEAETPRVTETPQVIETPQVTEPPQVTETPQEGEVEPPRPTRPVIRLVSARPPNPARLALPAVRKPEPGRRRVNLALLDKLPDPDPIREEAPPVPYYSQDKFKPLMPYADLDGDGIPNIEDDCPDIPGTQLNGGCPEVEEGFFKEDVYRSLYFDVAQDRLRAKSKRVLSEVADYLKESPDALVVLAGHTDNSGTERYNGGLSDRRADAARQYLLSLGIDDRRIRTFAYGETLPAASNKTPAGKQLNRRVDITFQGR